MRVTQWLVLSAVMLVYGFYGIERARGQGSGAQGGVGLAVINGQPVISEREVDELAGRQLFKLQQNIYTLRRSALENLLTRLLLAQEARARGVTVEELKRRLIPDKVEVSQDQIDQAYAENAQGLGNMPEDEAKERIRIELEGREKLERYQAALAEIRQKAGVRILLSAPVPPAVTVSPDGPAKGPKDAAVTVVAFSDFQCPFCKQAAGVLDKVLASHAGDVRLVYKHLPLTIHPQAFKAAQASVCAAEQGRFWEFHDRLFSSPELPAEKLQGFAAELGLKADAFNACLDSAASREVVLRDIREARRIEVEGTPTFVINGKLMQGIKSEADFRRVIGEEVKRTRAARGGS